MLVLLNNTIGLLPPVLLKSYSFSGAGSKHMGPGHYFQEGAGLTWDLILPKAFGEGNAEEYPHPGQLMRIYVLN